MISPYLFSTLQRKLANCPTCIFWSIPGQTSAFQSRYQRNIAQQSALRIHGQTNPRIILEGSVWMLVYKIFQQMHDPPQADWEDYFLAILVTNSFQETNCFVTIFLIPTYLYCVHIAFSCKVNGLSTMKKRKLLVDFWSSKFPQYTSSPVLVPELFFKYPTRPIPNWKTTARQALMSGKLDSSFIVNFVQCGKLLK